MVGRSVRIQSKTIGECEDALMSLGHPITRKGGHLSEKAIDLRGYKFRTCMYVELLITATRVR